MEHHEFSWAMEQSPAVGMIEVIEDAGVVAKPWDRRWLFAGPLLFPKDPLTLCPCAGEFYLKQVPLTGKIALISEGGERLRMAIGSCWGCKTLYWQIGPGWEDPSHVPNAK